MYPAISLMMIVFVILTNVRMAEHGQQAPDISVHAFLRIVSDTDKAALPPA